MSTKPVQLSDAQMSTVLTVAAPLQRQDLDRYFELVADLLRDHDEIGDGTVYHACVAAQRALFVPPALETHLGTTKYDRKHR
jgi:hypothetical protein